MYDVIIVGGGIVGIATARRLSRYQISIALLDEQPRIGKQYEDSEFIYVQSGCASKYSKLESRLLAQARDKFIALEQELGIGYYRIGSLFTTVKESQKRILQEHLINGERNGAEDLQLLDREETLLMEPNVNPNVKYSLYCANTGVCSPEQMADALIENAKENGVEFYANSRVDRILKQDDQFTVSTRSGEVFHGRYLVNATGRNTEDISQMLNLKEEIRNGKEKRHIVFQSGEGKQTNKVVVQIPQVDDADLFKNMSSKHQVEQRNLLLRDIAQSCGLSIEQAYYQCKKVYRNSNKSFIKKFSEEFSGLSYLENERDLVVEESTEVEGLIQILGVQSFGVSLAPAIAHRVTGFLSSGGLGLTLRENYNPYRRFIKLAETHALELKEMQLSRFSIGYEHPKAPIDLKRYFKNFA